MGYDRRRAALLTLSLSALLLAATLMPAAGVGTFPGFGTGADDDGSAVDAEPPEISTTPDESTATPTVTATPTPTETPDTPTPTRQTDTESTPEDDDQESWFPVVLLLPIALAIAVIPLGYVILVGFVAVVLGQKAASKLPFGSQIRTLPQATMTTLIGVSGSIGEMARSLRAGVTGVATGLQGLFGVVGTAGAGLATLFALPASVGQGLSLGFGSLFGSIGGALATIGRGSTTRSTPNPSETTTDARSTSAVEPETPTESEQEPLSVREAWDLLTDNLHLRSQFSKTPTEIRAEAIDRGWPSESVEQLTTAFQEVRYGQKGETDERLEAARAAIEHLQSHWEQDE